MTRPLLLTGCNGQFGRTVQQLWPRSPLADSLQLLPMSSAELDITDSAAVTATLDECDPGLIINAAAYTAVDDAESNSGQAYAVNERAVATLARWCAANNASLIHLSTDFVFDGSSSKPYDTDASCNPLGIYGASKLAGEKQVMELLPERGVIVRTSWLYSEYGSNFVKTMLRLMGERKELNIVDDQRGSPTSTHSLAHFVFALIKTSSLRGIYHWSDGGEISWFEFAAAIQQQALDLKLLPAAIPLHGIKTEQYPTPARRPAYSVLDRSASLQVPDSLNTRWQDELNQVLQALSKNAS